MKEEYIQFETAQLMKEKGLPINFDEYFLGCHVYGEDGIQKFSLDTIDKKFSEFKPYLNTKEDRIEYACPTQALLQRYLREVHNIHIIIRHDNYDKDDKKIIMNYGYGVYKNSSTYPQINSKESLYTTYEEALEIALQQALRIV